MLNWVVQADQHDDELYAITNKISGSFASNTMTVTVNVSDEDLDRIEKIQGILNGSVANDLSEADYARCMDVYAGYMQSHSHEFFHFYQSLSLPLLQVLFCVRKSHLKMQAVTMLQYFDAGGSYLIGETESVFDAFEDRECALDNDVIESFNRISGSYKQQTLLWRERYLDLSAFDLIEGMAHIASLQLSQTPERDQLDLEKQREYTAAFDVFQSFLDDPAVELRWQYLFFLYFCHFACQTPLGAIKGEEHQCIKVFYGLCHLLPTFLSTLKEKKSNYESYSRADMQAALHKELKAEDFAEVPVSAMASVQALFLVIPLIHDSATKLCTKEVSAEVEGVSPFIEALQKVDVFPDNIYQLAKLMIFPARFRSIYDVYESASEILLNDGTHSHHEESAFYDLITRVKSVMRKKRPPVWCCEEHGVTENVKMLLRCPNEQSIRHCLSVLTNRSIEHVLVIPEDY